MNKSFVFTYQEGPKDLYEDVDTRNNGSDRFPTEESAIACLEENSKLISKSLGGPIDMWNQRPFGSCGYCFQHPTKHDWGVYISVHEEYATESAVAICNKLYQK